MTSVILYKLFFLFIFLIQNASGVPHHLLPSSTNFSVDAPSAAESSNITKYLRYSTKDPKSSNNLSNSDALSFKLPYSNDGKDAIFFDSNKFPLYNFNDFHNKTSESVVSSGYPERPSRTSQNFVFPHSLRSKTPTVKDSSSSGFPSATEVNSNNLDNSKLQSKNCDSSLLNTNSSLLSKVFIDTISSVDQQSASRNMRQTTKFLNTPTSDFPKFLSFPNSAKPSTYNSESKISSSCLTVSDSKQDVTATKKPRFSNPVFERIFRPQSQSSQFSDRLSQQSDNSAISDSVKSPISGTSNFLKQSRNSIPNFTTFPSKVTNFPEEVLKSAKSASKTVINSQNKLTKEVNPFIKYTNPYSSSSRYENRNSISRPFYNDEQFSQTEKTSFETIPKSEVNSNIQSAYLGPVTRNYLSKNGVKISGLTQEAKPYTVKSPTNTNFLNTNSYTSFYNPAVSKFNNPYFFQKPQNFVSCEKTPISSKVLEEASAIQQHNSEIDTKNMESDQANILSSANPAVSKFNNPYFSQKTQNFVSCEKTPISSTVLEEASAIQQYNSEIDTRNVESDQANILSSANVPLAIGAQHGTTINNQNYQPNGPFTRVSVNFSPSGKPTSHNYIPAGISKQPTNTISLPYTYVSEVSPSTRIIPPISALPTVVSSPKVISSLLPTQTVTTSSSIPQELQNFIPRANDLSSKIVSSINDITTSITNNLLNTAANNLPPLNTYTVPIPTPNILSAPVFSPIFWPLYNPEISTFTHQPNVPFPIPSIISNPYVTLTSNNNELSFPFNSQSPVCDTNPPLSYETKPVSKSSTSDSKQLLPYIQTVTLNLPYLPEDTSENIILPYIISSTKNDCSSLAPPLTTSNWNAALYPSFIGPPMIKMSSRNNSKDIKRLLEFMVIAELLNNDKTCNFNAMDNIIALLCLSL